jgi:hypothetical protein
MSTGVAGTVTGSAGSGDGVRRGSPNKSEVDPFDYTLLPVNTVHKFFKQQRSMNYKNYIKIK